MGKESRLFHVVEGEAGKGGGIMGDRDQRQLELAQGEG
jgi:hypothetical protein